MKRLIRAVRWRLHVAKARATDPTWWWGHPDEWTDEEWWDYCRRDRGNPAPTTIPGWFQ